MFQPSRLATLAVLASTIALNADLASAGDPYFPIRIGTTCPDNAESQCRGDFKGVIDCKKDEAGTSVWHGRGNNGLELCPSQRCIDGACADVQPTAALNGTGLWNCGFTAEGSQACDANEEDWYKCVKTTGNQQEFTWLWDGTCKSGTACTSKAIVTPDKVTVIGEAGGICSKTAAE